MADTPHSPADREQVEEEAVQWLIKLASGEATAEDRAAADQWRGQSLSHEQAFRKAERLWQGLAPIQDRLTGLERALRYTVPAPQTSAAHTWTWRWSMAVAASLAALTLALLFRADLTVGLLADHRTGTGERIAVTLPDGSQAHLNTNSALALRYSAAERRIDLLAGEVDFAVMPDAGRPFIVQAAGGETRAVGTEFIVREALDAVSVTVLEGTVTTSYPMREQAQNATVQAAQQVRYGRDLGIGSVEPADLSRATAWRRGKLIFERTPLAQAVEELNRHRQGRVLLLNARLAQHRVSGVFDLHRLDEAVTAIERTLNLHAVHLPPSLAIWY